MNDAKKMIFLLTILFGAALVNLMAKNEMTMNPNPENGTSANASSWKFKTAGKIYATPIINNGVLYVGSTDMNLYAVDVKTGIEKWHYQTTGQIFDNALIAENIVCFESGNILYGLNLQGTLVWKITLYDGTAPNMNDEWDYYRSSPTLYNGVVYIGSEKGKLYGVDIKTGNKVFEYQTPAAKYTIETSPAIYDNKIYFGDWDGVFYVYDLSSSKLAWQFDTKKESQYSGWVNAIVTDPIIYKDAVYFGGRSCYLFCLDAKTGTKKWAYHDSGSMWMIGGPVILNDELFIGSSYQHVIHSFNALTGNLNWRANVINRVNGKPFVDGNYVIIGTEGDTDEKQGDLLVVGRKDGVVAAKLTLNTQVYSSPVIKDSIIYSAGVNGIVYTANYQQLFETKFANTSISVSGTLDLGKILSSTPVKKKFYVYNKGLGTDSISIRFDSQSLSASPATFNLNASDSVLVTITIDPKSLAPDHYVDQFTVIAYKGFFVRSMVRKVSYDVENPTDISSDKKMGCSFQLNQNYPNPFNPSTIISYSIPKNTMVRLSIFDLLGKEVAVLVNEEKPSGEYNYNFNAQGLSAGIYFCKLQAADKMDVKKIILLK